MAVEDVLARAPEDPWTVVQLGLAHAGLGRFDESREQVTAALRLRATPDMIGQVGVTRHPEVVPTTFRTLPQLVDLLRKVAPPPDSDFAEVVRGLSALLESHP